MEGLSEVFGEREVWKVKDRFNGVVAKSMLEILLMAVGKETVLITMLMEGSGWGSGRMTCRMALGVTRCQVVR